MIIKQYGVYATKLNTKPRVPIIIKGWLKSAMPILSHNPWWEVEGVIKHTQRAVLNVKPLKDVAWRKRYS